MDASAYKYHSICILPPMDVTAIKHYCTLTPRLVKVNASPPKTKFKMLARAASKIAHHGLIKFDASPQSCFQNSTPGLIKFHADPRKTKFKMLTRAASRITPRANHYNHCRSGTSRAWPLICQATKPNRKKESQNVFCLAHEVALLETKKLFAPTRPVKVAVLYMKLKKTKNFAAENNVLATVTAV